MPDPVIIPGGAELFRASLAFQELKARIHDIDTILRETGGLIAGGSVLMSLSGQQEASDLDIYVACRHLPTLLKVIRKNNNEVSSYKASEYCRSFLRKNGIRYVQTYILPPALHVDIMSVRHKTSPLNVVQNFDLTACQVWYDGKDVWATHPDHIAEKKMELQGDYVATFITGNDFLRNRMHKYMNRGFSISINSTHVEPQQLESANMTERSCTIYTRLEPTFKGRTWARKYIFRCALGTERRNLRHTVHNIGYGREINPIKEEEGYDSEDYVGNPQKIFDIQPKAVVNERAYEFLEFLEANPSYVAQWGGTVYEVPQTFNPNWEEDYMQPFRDEVLALLGPRVMWKGFTRKDVEYLDIVFDESVHAVSLSEANPAEVLYSMCPICLKYVSHGEGTCMYMFHDCQSAGGYYHKELYEKYKTAKTDNFLRPTGGYTVYWCTFCGRVCGNHQHYKLAPHTEANPTMLPRGAPYKIDCRISDGGGGTPEKIARFRALRRKALELNDQIEAITVTEAKNQLVEAMWDGPLTTPKNILDTMVAEKRFNIPATNFPANAAVPNMVYPDIPYPDAGNAALLPVMHPEATDEFKNIYDVDTENIVQFRHRQENGTINQHTGEEQQIAKSQLLTYVTSTLSDKTAAKFGMCWRFPYGDCTARMYSEELLSILDQTNEEEMTLYRQYKEGFNEKFAVQAGGHTSGHTSGKHMTRRAKRAGRGKTRRS